MPGGAHDYMRAWEPEEDALILKLVGEIGTKWKTINKNLVNRTTSSVRNRYARIKRGEKLIQEGAALKNRCHACGEIKRGHICKAKLRDGAAKLALPVAPATPVQPGASSSSDAAAPAAAALPVSQLVTHGVSVESKQSEEGEPSVPLVLKDLFPNDSKALEEAKEWMKDRKDSSLVAGHLASLSQAVEAQVKSMRNPLPLPPEFLPALKVTMPLSSYLASQARKGALERGDAQAQ